MTTEKASSSATGRESPVPASSSAPAAAPNPAKQAPAAALQVRVTGSLEDKVLPPSAEIVVLQKMIHELSSKVDGLTDLMIATAEHVLEGIHSADHRRRRVEAELDRCDEVRPLSRRE